MEELLVTILDVHVSKLEATEIGKRLHCTGNSVSKIIARIRKEVSEGRSVSGKENKSTSKKRKRTSPETSEQPAKKQVAAQETGGSSDDPQLSEGLEVAQDTSSKKDIGVNLDDLQGAASRSHPPSFWKRIYYF